MRKIIKKLDFRKIATVVLSFTLLLSPFYSVVSATELVISGNGGESTSEINVEATTETTVEQTNEADVSNAVNEEANTGDNTASGNTENTSISTGDVNSDTSINTSVNSSSFNTPCCQGSIDASISGNGADSTNSINLNQTSTTNVQVNQGASSKNSIEGSANTGGNEANNNGGDVSIDTGDIGVSGKIINGPINFADIDGTSGVGDTKASISGNGAGSTNSIYLDPSSQTNIEYDFFADIKNFLGWKLNTGGNTADGNSGDVKIVTGSIFFDFIIQNGPINVGGVDVDCCPLEPEEPGEEPSSPDGEVKPPAEEKPEEPKPSDEDGGVITAAAAAAEGGAEILGLADTGSGGAKTLFFWLGIIMLVFGLKITAQELYAKEPQSQF